PPPTSLILPPFIATWMPQPVQQKRQTDLSQTAPPLLLTISSRPPQAAAPRKFAPATPATIQRRSRRLRSHSDSLMVLAIGLTACTASRVRLSRNSSSLRGS